MNLHEIKEVINEQKENWMHVDMSDFSSREELKSYIEDDFLSENDISDRDSEFDDDVDVSEVQHLREEALIDVLIERELTCVDALEDETAGLEFSHTCGKCTLNNVHLDAYRKDEKTLKIIRYVTEASGNRKGKVDVLEISRDAYEKLDSDIYNSLIRFNAVNELFECERV